MTQGERVKLLRNELNLTLEVFGERVGVTRAAMSNIERGQRALTDQMAKSICREFNVNYFWLTEGGGKMFVDIPGTVLSEAIRKYDLDELDIIILEKYLHLTADQKKVFKEYFKSIVEEEMKRKQ